MELWMQKYFHLRRQAQRGATIVRISIHPYFDIVHNFTGDWSEVKSQEEGKQVRVRIFIIAVNIRNLEKRFLWLHILFILLKQIGSNWRFHTFMVSSLRWTMFHFDSTVFFVQHKLLQSSKNCIINISWLNRDESTFKGFWKAFGFTLSAFKVDIV